MGWGISPVGTSVWAPIGAGPVPGLAAILNSQKALDMKVQFIASENLRIVFPPFLKKTDNTFITLGDVVTLVIVKPGGAVYAPALVPVRDANSDFWTTEVPFADFEIGEWTVKATSDEANSLPQYQSVVWGDYMDEIRQATYGRWKITGTQLLLYAEDGTTVMRTFDLKDSGGLPTVTQIFERDPV